MESKAQLLGHSLHQILIAFPLGLLVTSVGFDAVGWMTHDPKWPTMSYALTLVGLLGGVAAMICGYIDYRAIPNQTRAKYVTRLHGWSAVAMMLCFAGSAYIRAGNPVLLHPAALACSLAGLALITVTGWLGGELVTRMGLGVADDANLDAPSSLTTTRFPLRGPIL